MLIYYAHSMLIYNTEKEKEEIEDIKKGFIFYDKLQDRIINPNGWIYDNGDEKSIMEQCYVFIKNCDCVVFSTLEDDIIGKGVYSEINKALEYGKNIFQLNNGKLYIFDREKYNKIEIVDKGKDWRKYAKVKL